MKKHLLTAVVMVSMAPISAWSEGRQAWNNPAPNPLPVRREVQPQRRLGSYNAMNPKRRQSFNEMRPTVALAKPSTLSLEVLGRGGLYSLNFDHSLSESVGLGIGMSYISAQAGDTSASLLFIPLYTNVYFSPYNHRPFFTAGLDVVNGQVTSADLPISGTGVLPNIGFGYEYRGDGGFLFRLAPYLFVGPNGVAVTGGVSFGASM